LSGRWQPLDFRAPTHTRRLELDIMRFPVSLLTAAALIDGIIVALMDEYNQEEESSNLSQTSNDREREDTNHSKAWEYVMPVSKEIVRLLGTSDVSVS
jgi:hypothetical protein